MLKTYIFITTELPMVTAKQTQEVITEIMPQQLDIGNTLIIYISHVNNLPQFNHITFYILLVSINQHFMSTNSNINCQFT